MVLVPGSGVVEFFFGQPANIFERNACQHVYLCFACSGVTRDRMEHNEIVRQNDNSKQQTAPTSNIDATTSTCTCTTGPGSKVPYSYSITAYGVVVPVIEYSGIRQQ